MNVKQFVGIAAMAALFCAGYGGDDNNGTGSGVGSQFNPNINYTLFTDSRDGKKYKSVRIGSQTWMAENLNYNVGGSVCLDSSSANCEKYGKLYLWSDAKIACPSGWHLPADAEWAQLTDFVSGKTIGNGNEIEAAGRLKSTSGWYTNSTDDYGFSALPGGYGNSSGFHNVGIGCWWSATESNAERARGWMMDYGNEYVLRDNYSKMNLFSVRCVQ